MKPLPAKENPTDEEVEMAEKVRQLAADVRRNRDMNNTEIKLTLSIEDPRIKAKRDVLGIEDERGASRDEVAGAFQTVINGGVPEDTVTLQILVEDLQEWLDLVTDDPDPLPAASEPTSGPSAYESVDEDDGMVRPVEKIQELMGFLPLYVVSAAPIIIAGSVVYFLWITYTR